jgi:uncharacterized protein YlzI (FlbEa/FlbD family)
MNNITLTSLDGKPMIINLDLVVIYEFGQPTILTLVTGSRIAITESYEDLKKWVKLLK